MARKTIIIRCNEVFSDPRAMKYIQFLKENRLDYYIIGWDRSGVIHSDASNVSFYHRKAGYNVGGIKAIVNRIGWMFFVLKKLIAFKGKNLFIHACDLDAVYPSIIYKTFFRKKNVYVLFDIFDWFSATLYSQPKIVLRAFKHMEKVSLHKCDKVLLCEKERVEQIPFILPSSKLSILPNIPYFSSAEFLRFDKEMRFNNNLITFSYVGGFAQSRCINEIITIAEQKQINLLIAGFGDLQIENRLNSLKGHPHLRYYGKVKYTDGLNIMYNSDVIYAMYSKINPNHIYAAPNKYYEAMFLGKPLFSTRGTIVEKKVLSNKTGYVSEESEGEIKDVISSITRESIKEYGDNSHRLWIEKYCTYTSDWLNNEYRSFIKD